MSLTDAEIAEIRSRHRHSNQRVGDPITTNWCRACQQVGAPCDAIRLADALTTERAAHAETRERLEVVKRERNVLRGIAERHVGVDVDLTTPPAVAALTEGVID